MEGWAEGISSGRTTRHVKAARGTCWAPAQAKFSPWMKEGGQPWSTIQPAPVHRRQAARGALPTACRSPSRSPGNSCCGDRGVRGVTEEHGTMGHSSRTHPSNQNTRGSSGAVAQCRHRVCEVMHNCLFFSAQSHRTSESASHNDPGRACRCVCVCVWMSVWAHGTAGDM